jgi:exodeoxyribonuclease-3
VSVRLLTYNIRTGGVGRVEQLAEVISAADADIVALQEATDPATVRQVAAAAGFPYFGSRTSHSTGFLSRVPVVSHAWRHPPRTRHAILEVSVADGLPRLFVVHLRAWFSRWTEQRRARELRGLLDGIRDQLVREHHAFAFHLVAGDFNALAPGEAFDPSPMPAWIRGMIRLGGREMARSAIDLMRAGGYVDAWRIRHPDSVTEPGFTFPVWNPHVRLDYVFTPEAYAPHVSACSVLATPDVVRTASDHLPLLVELT